MKLNLETAAQQLAREIHEAAYPEDTMRTRIVERAEELSLDVPQILEAVHRELVRHYYH